MPPVPMIAGLYFYARAGRRHPPQVTLSEIPLSLAANPWYRERLSILAGDTPSQRLLERLGLRVHRTFDDAPAEIHRDAAHKMKHWMCLWALREFGEFLWVDWDTVALREPDDAFWAACRASRTPKFIRIPRYHATVNCGVYYACEEWEQAMVRGLEVPVREPNDELLWRAVLPEDVLVRPEFWWGNRVLHLQKEADIETLHAETTFVHVKDLTWAPRIRSAVGPSAP